MATEDLIAATEAWRLLAECVVLDARPGSAYEAGHLPGAVWVDEGAWKDASAPARGGLQVSPGWEERIRALGIDGRRRVLVHDQGGMTSAARIWFILRLHGVDAAVIDGGFPSLVTACPDGRGLTVAPERPAPAAAIVARTERLRPALCERERLLEATGEEELQVLDVRKPGEYRGEDLGSNPRGGHVPGARLLPHAELLDDRGCLLVPDQLRARFEAAGVSSDRALAVYCQSGARSSLAALAALRAGYTKVENYHGSFREWSGDPECPLED